MVKKVCVSFFALCLFVVMFSSIAFASEIMPMSSDIITSTGLTLDTSGSQVVATATVKTTGTASKLGFSKITLYHKIDGVWKVAASTSGSYGYNNYIYKDSVSCSKVSGREYKASCSSYAAMGGSSDTGSASKGPTTAN